MTRPGPRPFECVRRAWHSESHQPMRGSLIQEIFRIVDEIHSSSTKRNKEWQQKLPTVVLKTEEIMYSKANSEAEYMDLKTLGHRANDAINTIIRRDKSTETGELLQPCIEAALYLGCTPTRASRRQRRNNPSCYLDAPVTDRTCVRPSNLEVQIQGNCLTKAPQMSCCRMNLTFVGSESRKTDKLPLFSEKFPPYASHNFSSVHPLYHENRLQSQDFQFSCCIPCNLNLNDRKPDKTYQTPKSVRRDPEGSDQNPYAGVVECDLSLRLAPLSAPYTSITHNWSQDVDDFRSRSSQKRTKSNGVTLPMDKGPYFFPKANAEAPLLSSPKRSGPEAENMKLETSKKRKVVFSYPPDDGQFCLQPKLPYYNLLIGAADVYSS
ncbi:hypothetical protein NMG60_11028034 [Bertholletia excelsa]